MGWMFYHRDPKAETNAEHFATKFVDHMTIVAHGTVDHVFYAAVHDARDDETSAFIALTQWRNHHYNFGYKDMSETMGPVVHKAPKAVLAALTPTTNEEALNWRARAAAYHSQRDHLTRHLHHGDGVRLNRALTFTDGHVDDTFTYIRPGQGKGYLTANGRRCRIPHWRDRVVAILSHGTETATPRGAHPSARIPNWAPAS